MATKTSCFAPDGCKEKITLRVNHFIPKMEKRAKQSFVLQAQILPVLYPFFLRGVNLPFGLLKESIVVSKISLYDLVTIFEYSQSCSAMVRLMLIVKIYFYSVFSPYYPFLRQTFSMFIGVYKWFAPNFLPPSFFYNFYNLRKYRALRSKMDL